jgi:hypothetical protein
MPFLQKKKFAAPWDRGFSSLWRPRRKTDHA